MEQTDQSGPQRFPYIVMQITQGCFYIYQVYTHVRTACESLDLIMDLRSFDNAIGIDIYARIIVSDEILSLLTEIWCLY